MNLFLKQKKLISMRKFLALAIAFACLSTSIFAQTPTELLEKAKKAVKATSGKKKEKFAEAQQAIEAALKVPEIQSGYEAYLLKAKLMNEMGALDDQERTVSNIKKQTFKPEYLNSGLDGANAVLMALKNTKDPKAIKEIGKITTETYNYLRAYAGEYSEKQDYVTSYLSFKTCLDYHEAIKAAGIKSPLEKIEDYNGVLYLTGLLSTYAQKEEEAAPIYQKLLDANKDSSFVYSGLYKTKLKTDRAGALKILEQGRIKYPNDNGMLFNEINHYLQDGKMDLLIIKLKEGIQKEPKNTSLVFTLGNVYDNLSQKETDPAKQEELQKEAMVYYSKTLEMDSKNVDAIYSIGATFYNRAAKLSIELKKLGDLPPNKENDKKYNAKEKEMIAEFDKALPFFQKAEALNPNDKNTLIALKEIFAKKNDLTLSKEFKTRFENVEAGGKNESPYFKQ
jgi:hypothetical protein